MQSLLFVLVLLVVVVWLSVITFYLRRMIRNYSLLTEGMRKKTLEDILTNMVKEQKISKKDIAFLSQRCDNIEREGLSYIQKIGLLRFNPFKDTGGDQSFILSLINAEDTGVVITALYSRSGTRWYAKRVNNGKGVEHELSEDEKKSLKMAKGS
ncbi:MAG TPA: DUF4446 family protein [Candidatus Saccharimonadales bacterium]|nr:DUF4446 family protein [Candidatus Saccharimonadales bacterium]